ncbi:MAG TPA: MoaD family protein [Candidatus Sulfotelmatobacter sp.]|nr:MoaD family protein [Candidatus Sulfotelmatobacter sp.]
MVVRFFASIRNITGEKDLAWEEATPTLRHLLHRLSQRYGPQFANWVFNADELGGSVLVIVNGDDARHLAGLETALSPTDVVSILPSMTGGSEATHGSL